ncbi:MAG TPA: hypothetical protein VK550_18670 [Polyangiaceae bacterium]|nr:hypothetical protein [Polyangiaceae bacterium]
MTDPHDPMSRIGRDVLPSSPLDDDRTASMADEGGVSGALMEIDDSVERKRLIRKQRTRFSQWRTLSAAFVLASVAVFAWGWLKRTA